MRTLTRSEIENTVWLALMKENFQIPAQVEQHVLCAQIAVLVADAISEEQEARS